MKNEFDHATEKQISFANAISCATGASLPKIKSKKEYRKFISENVGKFNKINKGIRNQPSAYSDRDYETLSDEEKESEDFYDFVYDDLLLPQD